MGYDYYKILELDRKATKEEIKKSYKRLALKWHPDRNNSEEAEFKFKLVNEAYQILSNSESKRQFDLYGDRGNESLVRPSFETQMSGLFGTGLFGRFFDSAFEDPFFTRDPFFSSQSFFSRHLHSNGFDDFEDFDSFTNSMFNRPRRSFEDSVANSSHSNRSNSRIRSRSVSTTVVNGQRKTVVRTVDEHGNETIEEFND